jgi:hypothetical protein
LQDLGAGWLKNASVSLHELLSTAYPQHEWLPWKFDQVPNYFWDDIQNQKKFLNWMGKQLKINSLEDWYKVTYKVPLPLQVEN